MSEEQIKIWKQVEAKGLEKLENIEKAILAKEGFKLKVMDMWSTGKKVFKWWMEDENLDGQLAFDLYGNIYEEYT